MDKLSKRLFFSLAATFSLSLSILFKKMALLADVQPLELLLQFTIITALLLSINLLFIQKKDVTKLNKIKIFQWISLFLAGSSLLAAFLFTTFGLNFTTSINYSFITRSNLIFTSIFAFFFLKEKMGFKKILLIISFFVGIYLVTTKGKTIIPQFGDLLILIGATFFSSCSVIQKKISFSLPPEVISWGVTLSAAMLAILVAILLKINLFPSNSFIFIFLVGLAEASIIFFMNKTIQIANVTYYAMMTMLVPIINGILGIFFLNEQLTTIQIIGGTIIILCGIFVQKLKY